MKGYIWILLDVIFEVREFQPNSGLFIFLQIYKRCYKVIQILYTHRHTRIHTDTPVVPNRNRIHVKDVIEKQPCDQIQMDGRRA